MSQNNNTVQRLSECDHVEVMVVERDPLNPEGPVTGCLNRYSYSFPRDTRVLASLPLVEDMEDVVRRGRDRFVLSRGRTYTAEETHRIRLDGSMLVYPDSEDLRRAAATVGEVRPAKVASPRKSSRTRDLAAQAVGVEPAAAEPVGVTE